MYGLYAWKYSVTWASDCFIGPILLTGSNQYVMGGGGGGGGGGLYNSSCKFPNRAFHNTFSVMFKHADYIRSLMLQCILLEILSKFIQICE